MLRCLRLWPRVKRVLMLCLSWKSENIRRKPLGVSGFKLFACWQIILATDFWVINDIIPTKVVNNMWAIIWSRSDQFRCYCCYRCWTRLKLFSRYDQLKRRVTFWVGQRRKRTLCIVIHTSIANGVEMFHYRKRFIMGWQVAHSGNFTWISVFISTSKTMFVLQTTIFNLNGIVLFEEKKTNHEKNVWVVKSRNFGQFVRRMNVASNRKIILLKIARHVPFVCGCSQTKKETRKLG